MVILVLSPLLYSGYNQPGRLPVAALSAELMAAHTRPVVPRPAVPATLRTGQFSLYTIAAETIREVTAYNVGDPHQTWGDPCESANGENICAALATGVRRCAANFVPLGTKLQVDTVGVCTVTDRMNRRYKNRVDVAMKLSEKRKALQFGRKKLRVRILEVKNWVPDQYRLAG